MKSFKTFITEMGLWHHGSPDMRSFKNGIEDRTDSLYNHDKKQHEDEPMPRPVYFAKDRRVAKTYANPHRAFDYQGSEPGIMTKDINEKTPHLLQVDAGGAHWADLTREMIKQNIPAERHEEFRDIMQRYAHGSYERNRLMTNDVAIVAHKMGYHGFHIKNIEDDYNSDSKRKPTSVLAVFPKHLNK